MSDASSPTKTNWLIASVAFVAAAAPHAFFAPPLQLHMEGQMDAWIGIAVWAPAILASVGFFFGVEFGQKRDVQGDRADVALRTSMGVLLLIVYAAAAAEFFPRLWTDMPSVPWDELKIALPLFAGLGALRAVFWQGFVQDRLLQTLTNGQQLAAMMALELIVVSPFLLTGSSDPLTAVILLGALEAVIAAAVYALGSTVRTVMLFRAATGLLFVWFQQALLL